MRALLFLVLSMLPPMTALAAGRYPSGSDLLSIDVTVKFEEFAFGSASRPAVRYEPDHPEASQPFGVQCEPFYEWIPELPIAPAEPGATRWVHQRKLPKRCGYRVAMISWEGDLSGADGRRFYYVTEAWVVPGSSDEPHFSYFDVGEELERIETGSLPSSTDGQTVKGTLVIAPR